jgi:hypothetical protein
MQSVPINTNIVSLNPAHDKVYQYSIQHYVIKFVTDLRQVWLPWYNWNIVESGIKHHKPFTPLENWQYSTTFRHNQ